MPDEWINRVDCSRGVLLDTSVVVAHLRRKIDLYGLAVPAESWFLSVVAAGELYKGAEKSVHPVRSHTVVDAFLAKVSLLAPTLVTARNYARMAKALESTGQKIPENDLWIAAAAAEANLPLATRDAHFERVLGLTVLRW